jgi:cytidylate kinase
LSGLELLGVYIDGETKTGKGAASQAVADTLTSKGLHVYYDVAGDFYRRYVALVRRQLGLGESDELPTGAQLEEAARTVHESRQAFEKDESLGDLQRPAIGKSVSVLGELPIAQKAGSEWFAISAERAKEAGADVIVLDGRNTRARMEEQLDGKGVVIHTVLELFMTCDPREAARRTLLGNGIGSPTDEQIEKERVNVISRRERDRNRATNPFILPAISVAYVPGETSIADVLKQSWVEHERAELPLAVTFDNTDISKTEMLKAVSDLAVAAVESSRS